MAIHQCLLRRTICRHIKLNKISMHLLCRAVLMSISRRQLCQSVDCTAFGPILLSHYKCTRLGAQGKWNRLLAIKWLPVNMSKDLFHQHKLDRFLFRKAKFNVFAPKISFVVVSIYQLKYLIQILGLFTCIYVLYQLNMADNFDRTLKRPHWNLCTLFVQFYLWMEGLGPTVSHFQKQNTYNKHKTTLYTKYSHETSIPMNWTRVKIIWWGEKFALNLRATRTAHSIHYRSPIQLGCYSMCVNKGYFCVCRWNKLYSLSLCVRLMWLDACVQWMCTFFMLARNN